MEFAFNSSVNLSTVSCAPRHMHHRYYRSCVIGTWRRRRLCHFRFRDVKGARWRRAIRRAAYRRLQGRFFAANGFWTLLARPIWWAIITRIELGRVCRAPFGAGRPVTIRSFRDYVTNATLQKLHSRANFKGNITTSREIQRAPARIH